MNTVMKIVDRIEVALIALLAGASLALASVAMLGRYVFPGVRLDWTFELTIFTMIWAIFIAGARVTGRGEHVRVDSFLGLLPPMLRRVLAVLTGIGGIAMAIFLVHAGIGVVDDAIRWNERSASSLRVPLWIYYLSLPTGMALLALHLTIRVAGLWRGTVTDDPRPGEA